DIGSRLYSTIEQGKIDQVLTARPKDRRAMFEEAAGIHGYRSKRRQAELKLEAAQANLLRINDIVAEVEKQIHALRRQAAKARRYQRLVDDLRDSRLILARQRLKASDEEGVRTEETLRTLRAQELAAAASLSGDEANLEQLRLRLDSGEDASRARREEIHALDLEVDRLKERLRAGREQVQELDLRLAQSDAELESLRPRLAELEGRLADANRALSDVRERLRPAAAEPPSAQADDSGQADAIGRLEGELERARRALLERIEQGAAIMRVKGSLEEQARAARASLAKVALEREDLRESRRLRGAELTALEGEVAEGSVRAEGAGARHQAALEAERAASERIAAAERRAEESKGRGAVLSERLAALLEMERQHAGFSEGAGDVLKGAAGVSPRGVVGDRLDVPPGLSKAAEATLRDLLEAVVVDGPDEVIRAVDYLRASGRGRVSFVTETASSGSALPGEDSRDPSADGLESLSRAIGGAAAGPIARILSRTILVDDLAEALRRHASRPDLAYVTRQGDIVDRDGSVTGGDGRALSHWLLQRRAEREELAVRASEAAAVLRESEEAMPRLREDLTRAQEELQAASADVQALARGSFEIDLRLQKGREELDRIDRAETLFRSEQARLERDIEAFDRDMAARTADLEAAESGRRADEASIQALGAELALSRDSLDRARRESAEGLAVRAADEQRRDSLERETAGLGESISDLSGTLSRRAFERDEWAARVSQIRAQEGDLEAQLQTALQARAEAAARDETAHAGLAYERGLLHAREQAVKDGRVAQSALRERAQQHELQRARLEADLEHLARTCRDELGTTIEALRDSAAPADDGVGIPEREAEVQRLRSDIETIGPVNLMAVEQQADLEERFSFLTTQKRDLDEATASLKETIKTINREARERFKSAFEAIQGHFQECFRTLFGGGRAEVRLAEDEEDVLEAGVEVAAQPPGKRMQKIALLSGGEKALTAVALLVSLFRYRPSPFCILDEVDAPLDEANVERFTRLLQEMRSDTQLILITHNRKSMEAADLLYGVTMEEPGVSKILPLRFE
ncbi:MAG TPA: chromosome segregation protein SMC, partial [Candidatus Polarisedimenticolia bacterium]|nr:chromosome segregation protein SMC [Candidatus Polarisedimenticolia bacterium]